MPTARAWPRHVLRRVVSGRRYGPPANTLTIRRFCGLPLARRRLSGPPPLHKGGKRRPHARNKNAPLAVAFSTQSTPTLHHARARLRPSRQTPTRLSRSFALPKPGPPNLGGRGFVRAGKRQRGSAGASPSQNLVHRTWEGEAGVVESWGCTSRALRPNSLPNFREP